jgi:hypothetical protein
MKVSSSQLIRVYNGGFLSSAQKKFKKDAAKLARGMGGRWHIQNIMKSAGKFGYRDGITVVYTR